MSEKIFSRYLSFGSLMGMVAGIVLGLSPSAWRVEWLLPYAEGFAKLWIIVLLLLAIPLVSTYLLVSLLHLMQSKAAGKLALCGISIHVVMLVLGAGVSILLGVLLLRVTPPIVSGWTVTTVAPGTTFTITQQLSLLQTWIARLIIPFIIATLLFAVIINFFSFLKQNIVEHTTRISKKLFTGLRYVFLALPFSVASLALIITMRNGALLPGIAGVYIAGVCLVLILFTLVQYAAVFFFGHISVKQFFRDLLPSQWVAASTCSSLATLPALLVSMKRMGVADEVAGSAVPVFVSFFRVNLLVANPFSFLLLSHLYNLPIELPNVLLFLGLMMLTSFGSPGLPQTGNVYSLPVFLAAGIPLEGVVILKALDAIPDVFKTILNVTETAAVTSLTVRWASRGETVVPKLDPQLPV